MNMYIGIYSAEHDYDIKTAGNLRDHLKSGGVRARFGPSCYVGHKMVEIHIADLRKASKFLCANAASRSPFDTDRWVAKLCREAYTKYKGRIKRARSG